MEICGVYVLYAIRIHNVAKFHPYFQGIFRDTPTRQGLKRSEALPVSPCYLITLDFDWAMHVFCISKRQKYEHVSDQ